MSKAPIEISSKEQFKDILKKSRVVVADCEFRALSTRQAWTTPASERRPRAQIRSRPEGLRGHVEVAHLPARDFAPGHSAS